MTQYSDYHLWKDFAQWESLHLQNFQNFTLTHYLVSIRSSLKSWSASVIASFIRLIDLQYRYPTSDVHICHQEKKIGLLNLEIMVFSYSSLFDRIY